MPYIKLTKVQAEMSHLKNVKSPGSVNIGKGSGNVGRLSYFPKQWKCAEIIMIPKSSQLDNEISSPNIFERILLQRLLPFNIDHTELSIWIQATTRNP